MELFTFLGVQETLQTLLGVRRTNPAKMLPAHNKPEAAAGKSLLSILDTKKYVSVVFMIIFVLCTSWKAEGPAVLWVFLEMQKGAGLQPVLYKCCAGTLSSGCALMGSEELKLF